MQRTAADNITRLPFDNALLFTLEMIPLLPQEIVKEILFSLGLPQDSIHPVDDIRHYIDESNDANIVPQANDLIHISSKDGNYTNEYFSQGHSKIIEIRYASGDLKERWYIGEYSNIDYLEAWDEKGVLTEKFVDIGPFYNEKIRFSIQETAGEDWAAVTQAKWRWYLIKIFIKVKNYTSLINDLLKIVKSYLYLQF